MEKTIQITIASTTFSLTENAYEKLSTYLETLKAHFVAEPESAEIMRDIESRIAEKLFHKKQHVVTEDDVNAIVSEIGDASEFEDDTEEPEAVKGASSRRLYRDIDNAWIGGVSSGIAAYLDVDPLWVRLAFLLSLIFGGAGILIYLIFWVLIPEAKNAGQKLEMRGKPVDVENIARVVREGVHEVRESGIIRRSIAMIGRFIRNGLKLIGYGFGALFTLGGFFGTIGLCIGLGVIMTNWNSPYNDLPLRNAVPDSLLVIGIIAGFIAILIPLIAIFSLGIRLITRRVLIPSIVSFGLIGIWALALSVGGTVAAKAAGDFYQYVETAPEYQIETRTIDVAPFTSLDITDAHVVVRNGTSTSVRIEGRARGSNQVTTSVNDNVLSIAEKRSEERVCMFCSYSSPSIIITTPSLDGITIDDGSIRFEEYEDNSLSIAATSAFIRGALDVTNLTIDMENGTFSGKILASGFTLTARDAHVNIDGTARQATISLSDSTLNARTFSLTDAQIEADASHAEVKVSGTLDHPRVINSFITNVGREEIEHIESRSTSR